MKNDSIILVGLDTHKESTEVAYSLDGRENSPAHFGKIQTTKQAFTKLIRHFQSILYFKKTARNAAFCL